MKTLRFLLPLAIFFCLANVTVAQTIQDADADTKVETERTPDEDIIWFSTIGVDRARFVDNRLEFLNTGGSIFIGDGAGLSDDLSNNLNLFIGDEAGTSTTTGPENVGLGRRALFQNTTGSANMGIGSTTLYNTTTGNQNAGIGKATLYSNTTGSRNVGIGFSTLRNAVSADDNVALGARAGFNTTGGDNVLVGSQSGFNNQAGTNNVLIGFQAGRGGALHSKSGSVMIGSQAGYNETGSNKLYIENTPSSNPLIYGEFDTDKVAINGQLGVGVTPTRPVDIDGIATAGQMMTIDATAISSGNDLIQLTVPSGTTENASFIEFQQSSSIVANIEADGSAEFKDLIVDGKASNANDGNIIVEEQSTGYSRMTMRNNVGIDYWDVATLTNDSSASQMRFWYSNQTGNQRNILTIDGTDHKVGVNTTSPNGFLSVEAEGYSTSPGIDVDVNYSGTSDVRAVDAYSVPAPGYGYGVQGTGGYMGIRGIGSASTYTGTAYGVYGSTSASTSGTRNGVFGTASGGTTGSRYGVNGSASGGDTGYGTRGYASGTGDRYGAHGEAYNSTSGTGYGLYGEASGGTSGIRYGSYSTSSGGSASYGSYSYADGTTNNGTRYGAYNRAENGTSGTHYGTYSRSDEGSSGYGVYALCYAGASTTGNRYGVRAYASGGSTSGNTYGIYGQAVVPSGSTGEAWGGYFPTKSYMTELRIGTLSGATGYKLMVNGKAIVEELKVQDSGSWPDYVFADEYELKPLEEVEAFIKENKHLPNIPSADEICDEDGFMVGEMQNKTIEKVEELTLYMIDANKRIKELEKQNKELQEAVKALLNK